MDWGGGNIPALSANNVKMGFIDFKRECYLGSEELYDTWMTKGHTQKNDIVFTMEAPLGNAALIPDSERYILSQRVILLRCNDSFSPEYLYQFMMSDHFQDILDTNSTGTTAKGIQQKRLIKLPLLRPPLPEQKKIARILSSVDSKLALIDQQITTTQTLKKGLMQKLFTQGVGTQDADGRWQPHTEFQETELGRIPVGWKCLPLSKVARISSGGTPARGEPSFWNGEIPWVTTGEIFFNTIFKTKENITVSGQENSSAKLFPVGTVLMAMYGQGKTRGQVAKLGIEATTNQACAAIMPYKGCDSDYLYLYLEMTYQKNRQSGNEGSQKNLNAAIIKSFMIPLAPFDEQQEIARILSTVDRKLNHLHTQKTQTQQLKKGLMQKLLTGQIRVQPDPQDT